MIVNSAATLKPKAGNEDFAQFINGHYYYVDKTQYLKEIFSEYNDRLLILRPRRFGKTLMMSTLRHFLEISKDNPGDTTRQQKLFKGLRVLGDHEFTSKCMGQFPVVYFTFNGLDGTDFDSAIANLADKIYRLAAEFEWLLDSDKLNSRQKKELSKLLDQDLYSGNKAKGLIASSLITLCSLLLTHFNRHPVVLIDEYDVPLQKAVINGYYQEMLSVIRPLLSQILKGNSDPCKVIMTGCLRASKESIFTGMNNIEVNTVLNNGNSIATAFGFTPDEVQKMFRYYGFESQYEKARLWYDGYSIDGNDLFCPWDVCSYCKDLATSPKAPEQNNFNPRAYWNGSSSNDIIREFLPFLESGDADRMEALIKGGSVQLSVSDSLNYGELNEHHSEHFWSVLLYTGYLTLDKGTSDNNYLFRIPNSEIQECFRDQITKYYSPNGNGIFANISETIAREFIEGKQNDLLASLSDTLESFVSVRDSAVRSLKENYYHGFINGLLAPAAKSKIIRGYSSNMESGDGYPDITFNDSRNSTGTVIELKHVSDRNGLKQAADDALSQIISKNYAERLFRDGRTEVTAWGIAFCGRHCDVSFRRLRP